MIFVARRCLYAHATGESVSCFPALRDACASLSRSSRMPDDWRMAPPGAVGVVHSFLCLFVCLLVGLFVCLFVCLFVLLTSFVLSVVCCLLFVWSILFSIKNEHKKKPRPVQTLPCSFSGEKKLFRMLSHVVASVV